MSLQMSMQISGEIEIKQKIHCDCNHMCLINSIKILDVFANVDVNLG